MPHGRGCGDSWRLGLVAAVIAACGGGSSSSSGPSAGGGSAGGSRAVIQGQIIRARSAALRESVVVVALRTTLGIGLAEAAAGNPVVGATVTLTETTTLATYTTTATASGNFSFENVDPGTYTIEAIDSNNVVVALDGSSTSSITVGAGDTGTIAGTVTETEVALTVHVEAANAADLVHNTAPLCHAVSIATASGRDLGDVIAARYAGSGHGSGKIAKVVGVPPSVLGNNSCTESQISQASAIASGPGKGKGKGQS